MSEPNASHVGGSPRFRKPPVIEVAISVQFRALERFGLVDYGLLWEHWRDRYPLTKHQPPLAPVTEVFGSRRPRVEAIRVEPVEPLGRCWYHTVAGDRLLQVQPDRFILNWQKADGAPEYPSYEVLRKEFERALDEFLAFVHERDLGAFEATQCEVIYVNHLERGREWTEPQDIADVLAPLSGSRSRGASLPPVEDIRLAWQYRYDVGGRPFGRLHVLLNSAERVQDGVPLFVLQMLARGAPSAGNPSAVLAFADQAHAWITRAFADLTTTDMHSIWEREA